MNPTFTTTFKKHAKETNPQATTMSTIWETVVLDEWIIDEMTPVFFSVKIINDPLGQTPFLVTISFA